MSVRAHTHTDPLNMPHHPLFSSSLRVKTLLFILHTHARAHP